MSYNQNNKRAVENFLVASQSDQGLPTGDDPLVSGTAIGLGNGQLGIVDASGLGSNTYLDFLTAADTAVASPAIQIYQGTADSADPSGATARYPLTVRPYEKSGIIDSTASRIVATKQLAAAATHNIWNIGDVDADGVGDIVSNSNTEYRITMSYRGRIMDEFYNPEATSSFEVGYTTPDYDALGITTDALKRDHLIQNLVWRINRQSRALAMPRTQFKGNEQVIAFAISTDTSSVGDNIGGNGGGETAIAADDSIVVVSDPTLGNRSYTISDEEATSIKNAAVSASGDAIADVTWHILDVDLATAGTATGGTADLIMIMALDRPLAYEDRIPQVKIRLDVGLTTGFDFNTVTHDSYEEAYEGEGQGRALDLWYKATQGQRKYSLDHQLDPHIEYPSPIDTTESYLQYTIHHSNAAQVDTGNIVVSPMKEVVLIPSSYSTTISAFDAVLDPWLESVNSAGIVTV